MSMESGMVAPSNSSMSVGAVPDLGLGGALNQQVQDETDEERKKRLAQMQRQQALGPSGSLAVTSLFGPRGGMPGAGA
jgi:hypothetical protein